MGTFSNWNSPGSGSGIDLYFPHIFLGQFVRQKPIYDIIRENSSLSANEILNAMLESLKRFQKGAKIEDDITLVVIKIKD